MNSILDSHGTTLAETNDEDKLKISYEEEFEEIKCIGRGNFGAAFLVKLRQAPADQEIYFIAKKIILGQLTEKEKEGAHLEVRPSVCILLFSNSESHFYNNNIQLFDLPFSFFRLISFGSWITRTSCPTSTPSSRKAFSSSSWNSVSMVTSHITSERRSRRTRGFRKQRL